VKNCLITDNEADDDGGGARVDSGARLLNSTVSENSAGGSGDGVRCVTGGFTHNSIIYFNDAGGSADDVSGSGTFTHSCSDELTSGAGNVTGDPHFVNRAADNFQITGAPCKDAGSNAYLDWEQDLAGTNRLVNGSVDMGAYEVQ